VRASFIGSFACQRHAGITLSASSSSPVSQVSWLRGEVDTLERAHARVAHDLYYIEHWSLWLDLKILLQTVGNSCLHVTTHTDICMIYAWQP
jgi:lipopolysaccharide/colanic/teichoic acid biosynthesis glycosyltransferase